MEVEDSTMHSVVVKKVLHFRMDPLEEVAVVVQVFQQVMLEYLINHISMVMVHLDPMVKLEN